MNKIKVVLEFDADKSDGAIEMFREIGSKLKIPYITRNTLLAVVSDMLTKRDSLFKAIISPQTGTEKDELEALSSILRPVPEINYLSNSITILLKDMPETERAEFMEEATKMAQNKK